MLKRTLLGLALYLLSGAMIARAGQFLEAPQYPTGTNPQAVALGDFNRDGKPDLAVANSTSNTVSVLLGNGDNTFQPKVDYATGTNPQGIAVGDFNGDGILDLAVTNSASNTVSVFLGNGDGTFRAKADYATGRQPQGVAVGDFNGDGHLDLVVTNAADNTVGVLSNGGNGTFSAQVPYRTGVNPYSVVVGDFNQDGKADMAVADDSANSNNSAVTVLLNSGKGTFQRSDYTTAITPVSIAAGDVNGDGYQDLVVADQQANMVSILLNKGDGSGGFLTAVQYDTAAYTTSVVLEDFNGDNKLDIAVAAGNGNTLSVLLGNGDGTFQTQVNYGTGDIPYAVAAGDLNGDTKIDLVIANSGGNNVSVLVGNGDGSFQTRVDYGAGSNPVSVAAGDFNGDGFLDLAVAISNCSGPPFCGVSILLGSGDGTFHAPSRYSTGNNTVPYSVTVADLNGDGKLDLAVANYATNTVSVMLGVGDGTFRTHVDYPVGSEPTFVAIGDVDGDGKLDLVVSNFNSNTVSVLLGNGDGTFQSAVNYNTGLGPIALALADFNGDHKLDLVVVNETVNNVGVFLGNGDGTFQAQVTYSTGTGGNPLSVTVGDFNGDQKLDLAVADFHTQQVSVLLGNGDGTFQVVKAYPTGANPSSVVTTDFNGDGKLDLAFTSTPVQGSPGSLLSLLLGQGDGTFGAPALFGTGSQVTSPFGSAAVGDFNRSGTTDIAVANGFSNTVSVLLNSQGTRMSIESSGNPSLFGQSVTFTTKVGASVSEATAPTGTVTVKSGSTVLGSATVVGGMASVSTTSLPTGTHSVSAAYSGDTNFQQHTVGLTQTVQTAGSSTALVSSANPATEGQPVAFTATVSSATSGTPTGTVAFLDGTTMLSSSALNGGGMATFSTSSLSLGTHSITAAFSGDTNFSGGTSPVLSQVVQKWNTNTALTSSPNPSSMNQSVTFTAKVSSGNSVTPTGTVSFLAGTALIGTSALSASGTATLNTSTLAGGTHFIMGAYSGDANFDASTSSALSQLVQQGTTAATLISSSDPSTFEQPVTLTATVTSSAKGTPTGTVTFSSGTMTLGSAALNASGTATLMIATLPVGTDRITAAYSGDTSFNGTTSPALSEVVQKANTTTALKSLSNSAGLGLTATVGPETAGTPTGTVNFMDGTTYVGSSTLNASGVATFAMSTLTAGTHNITAAYGGDGNFNASSSSTASIAVDFKLSVSALSPSSVAPGQSATASVTITPLDGFNPLGVIFVCSIAPAVNPTPTCSAGTISVLNGTGTATVTVSTVGSTAAGVPGEKRRSGVMLASALFVPAMLLGTTGLRTRNRTKLLAYCFVFVVFGGCLFQAACGGGGTSIMPNRSGPSGTPAGSYTITVTGSANGTEHTTSTTLTVQ